MRAKRALKRLNQFVLGYNFNNCKELFDADIIRMDEKTEEKMQEKVQREERLRKLKPMKSRMLFFKNRTFRIDTLNRDVQWATEKRLAKNTPALMSNMAQGKGPDGGLTGSLDDTTGRISADVGDAESNMQTLFAQR